MSAIYSPPGSSEASKTGCAGNRTPADAEANRKKHGIVYHVP
jgi:hypothetical protein